MKNVLPIILLLMLSCNSVHDRVNKRFFGYDEIVYYVNNISEEALEKLYDIRHKSAIDSLTTSVILDDTPRDINDLSFIDKLADIGFKKSIIDKSKFAAIDEIFREQIVLDGVETSCIYVYRDILIFKKKGKVVGTAKICFSCMANQIRGAKANTENFGQAGDYDKLEQLLKK